MLKRGVPHGWDRRQRDGGAPRVWVWESSEAREGEVEKERVSLGARAEPYLEKRRCGSYWT